MAKYDISWAGLDRGHEGLWRPDVWIAPLKALARYSSVDYSDAKHAIYKELTRECPNVEWLSFERQSKTARSLFRDNREPWYSTGVITFVGTSMSVSPLGKQILAGELTYSQVLARAMAGWEEHGENPFAILSDAFLRIGAYRGLSFDDVVRIMQNFREGDDVCLALEEQVCPLSGVAPRRLKAILLLMVYSGAITCVGNVYFLSDRQELARISGSDKFDVDEFGLKIGDQSDDGSVTIVGADRLCYQVRSVSRGAVGVRTISKKLLGEWVIAVKDDPTATAESLRGKLTGKTEVDKFEYGYFSTLYKMAQMVLNKDSIKKLSAEELSRLIKGAKTVESSSADRLAVALKLFAERRKASASSDVRYWVYSPGENACAWDEVMAAKVIALSYKEVGDYSKLGDKASVVAAYQSAMDDQKSHKNSAQAIVDFRDVMKPGDIVFTRKGLTRFIAVGRVSDNGDFFYDDKISAEYPNRRKIDWFKIEDYQLKVGQTRQIALYDITGNVNLVRELCEAYGVALGASNDGGWFHEGRSVNGRIREYFDSLTEEKIRAFSDEDLKEFFCHSETDPATHVVFEHMWSGKNGQGWGNIKPSSAAELKDATDYLVGVRRDVSVAATFLQKDAKHPKGFGPSVVSELLMKFHPESCFKHGSVSRNVLKHLGLVDFASEKSDYDEDEYKLVCGAAALILGKMKAMKIARQINADGSEDTAKPDYLTVNEFIWFVNENKDLIKEKVMSAKMKKPNIAIKAGTNTLGALIGQDPDSMMSRLTAALLTKPFAILAGASGTGKSRMVRQLAYMTCLNTDLQDEAKDATAPGNYRLVQVKPNWHDSSDLLGYRSAINEGTYVTTDFVKFVLKAHAYPDTPFFVCLDEMNLAPVEQYFAEFLSASEDVKKADDGKTLVSAALIKPSDFGGDVLNLEPEYELAADRKALIEKIGLFIPHNLYVVGTVNMDDTTCQFSRKVLDRAMTIEMNEVKLETLQKNDVMTFDDLLLMEPEIKLFTERAEFDGTKLDDPFRDKLDSLRGDLESSPFAIAYRFAREAVVYREAIAQIGNDAAKAAKDEIALDHMALMKILPRITGTTTERKGVTDKLTAFFSELGRPLSLKKLNEMIAAAPGNGDYLSFWP